MRIISWKGNEISSLENWASLFSESHKSRHWKEGRSAYSLSDFIMNHGGGAHLESRISSVLSQPVKLETATPEFLAKFDSYKGNRSNLDLGINGRVGSGASLFVGVEAKVDEEFGKTVGKTYRDAIKKRDRGERTKAPDRVKELVSQYASEPDDEVLSRFEDIRYQLLTATAGTVGVGKDVSVFYVLVFKTRLYDQQKGDFNQMDYEKFLNCVGGKSLAHTSGVSLAHEIALNGKRLTCIYDYVRM